MAIYKILFSALIILNSNLSFSQKIKTTLIVESIVQHQMKKICTMRNGKDSILDLYLLINQNNGQIR